MLSHILMFVSISIFIDVYWIYSCFIFKKCKVYICKQCRFKPKRQFASRCWKTDFLHLFLKLLAVRLFYFILYAFPLLVKNNAEA